MSESLLRFHRYFPLDLREIMRVEGDRLCLDRARFTSWIRGFLRGMRRPAQDRAGRPSQKGLVLEIHREPEECHCSLTGVTAEARGIHSEIRFRYPDRLPPTVKTIARHLRNLAP